MRRVTSLDEQLHPGRSERASLGSGFVITGRVRAVADCTPLEGVRVQVWLATETGGEQDNRASVRTGPDGRYRIETDRTIPQFSPTARSTAPVPWSCSRS
jgi:protocatechuate 3,4-dioxygenase beta subunit